MSLSHYSKCKTYSHMKQGEELTLQYWKSVLLFKKTIIKKIINNTTKLFEFASLVCAPHLPQIQLWRHLTYSGLTCLRTFLAKRRTLNVPKRLIFFLQPQALERWRKGNFVDASTGKVLLPRASSTRPWILLNAFHARYLFLDVI